MTTLTPVESPQLNFSSGMPMNTFAKPKISADPSFQVRVDDADPFVCHQDILQGLLDDAPDEYAQGFLAGIYQFRLQLAILTDRPF